jgi:hypothetical protein
MCSCQRTPASSTGSKVFSPDKLSLKLEIRVVTDPDNRIAIQNRNPIGSGGPDWT